MLWKEEARVDLNRTLCNLCSFFSQHNFVPLHQEYLCVPLRGGCWYNGFDNRMVSIRVWCNRRWTPSICICHALQQRRICIFYFTLARCCQTNHFDRFPAVRVVRAVLRCCGGGRRRRCVGRRCHGGRHQGHQRRRCDGRHLCISFVGIGGNKLLNIFVLVVDVAIRNKRKRSTRRQKTTKRRKRRQRRKWERRRRRSRRRFHLMLFQQVFPLVKQRPAIDFIVL